MVFVLVSKDRVSTAGSDRDRNDFLFKNIVVNRGSNTGVGKGCEGINWNEIGISSLEAMALVLLSEMLSSTIPNVAIDLPVVGYR